MTAVVVLAALALAFVAAAGVAHPFTRGEPTAAGEPSDPLEEERAALLLALRELERDRAAGLLSEQDYRELRTATETRAVAVLRALEARDGESVGLAAEFRDLRAEATPDAGRDAAGGQGGPTDGSRMRRLAPLVVGSVALLALVVPVLAAAVRDRAPGEPIAGTDATQPTSPLAFFEERVARHPRDVAARLDLARRYLDAGAVSRALVQYLAALRLDPDNPEAHATLGFLLHRAGSSERGLEEVERALEVAPGDPEALYYKGVILLQGLNRPREAAEAFRAYLDAAPFGGRRDEVRRLLESAEAGSR